MESKPETKPIDNKRLTKLLFISGFGLLILFICVRLLFKSQADRITDMPTVGQLSYTPKRIEEKSKMQQFEENKKETERKKMGYEENNYVVPNFNEFTKKSESIDPVNKTGAEFKSTVATIKPAQNRTLTTSIAISSQKVQENTPSSKLDFHSNYFNSKKDISTVSVAEQAQASTGSAPAEKNPFGTISLENSSLLQKSNSASALFSYKAEVYGDQKIENGGIVMLRSTEGFQLGAISVAKNSIFYGQAVFQGNRVHIKINRIKTPTGEFPASLAVQDNDRMEGIYYKAPIDEVVDKTTDQVNAPQITSTYGGVINSITQAVTSQSKALIKKTATLNLEDGYKLFIIPPKKS